MNAPLVCAVILNWNGWRDTIECARSLEQLDYPNYRIVIVDNGSTDDSLAQLRLCCKDATILPTGKNLGFGGGNNAGIAHALGCGADYVWLLNSDTTVAPNALSEMIQAAEIDARIGMVGSVLYLMDDPQCVQAWGGGEVNLWSGVVTMFSTHAPEHKMHYLSAASLLIRATTLREIGLFDDGFFLYWEDTDLGLRARNAGWRLVVADGAKVLHKESASLGKGSARADLYFNASFIRFCRKHAPAPIVPIVIRVSARLLKRILTGDWQRTRAVWRGASMGIKGERPSAP